MSTERIAAHHLLENIQRTTPGGITREQFVRRHPVKTLAGALPFVALVLAGAFYVITR
jgi:hypothetical protein